MALLEINTSIALLGLIAIATLVFVLRKGGNNLDPLEPPEIKSTIPVFGHVFGLLGKGAAYYAALSTQNPDLPAFTVNIPQAKTYIITSPSLLSAAQRNSRDISFEPFLTQAAERIAGCSPESVDKVRPVRSGGNGGGQHVVHKMHPALLGEGLDGMNEAMIKGLKEWIDELAFKASKSDKAEQKLDLFDWCKEAMTVASTFSMWGPMNPFDTKFMRDCFWEFENGVTGLVVKFAPHIIARKAWKAREAITNAFVTYYESGGHEQGSALAKVRWEEHNAVGISPISDIARLEASMCFGLLSNTIPTTFWLLFDLYSRPDLLWKVREEVRQNALHIVDNSQAGANKTAIVDLADIREKCPFFVSTFQESIRFRSIGAPARYLFEDVILEGYLLKKGSALQMPSSSIHSHPSSWGSTATEFNPSRFLKSESPRKLGGFLGFGVTPSVCPGRHFASSEILSLAAALILRFDFTPAESSTSSWVAPPVRYLLTAAVPPPATPFHVKATLRDDYRDYEWDFRVTKGKAQFGLVIG